MFRVLEF